MYERYEGLPNADADGRSPKNNRARGGSGKSAKRGEELQSSDIYPSRHYSGGEGYSSTRASTPSRSRSASGSGRGSSKRKKRRQRRTAFTIGGIVLVGLIVLACVVLFKSCTKPVEVQPETDVYRESVTVNGIDISGMTLDQAREAVKPGLEYTFANIAITLQNDDFSHRITGEEMGATSDLENLLLTALAGGSEQDYYTTLSFDYQQLDNRIAEINETLATGPTDATFTVTVDDNGKPNFEYHEGVPGYGLNIASTEELVKNALENNQLQAVLAPELTMVQPTLTVEDIKAHTALRGKFTTTYRADGYSGLSEEETEIIQNRAFNISKGAERLNNLAVKPGETVSFNKAVGDRTEEDGWKLANAIIFGKQYTLEAGGGICQVSTTLYGALLRSDIEVTYRRHHSFPSDYVDIGLDATVDTGHIDFKFKNETSYPIYVFAYVTKNKSSNRKRDITVAIYGEALPEGVTYEPRTELIEELLPGEPTIVYDKKKTEDYNVVEVNARNGYIIDVYLDKLVNGKVEQGSSVKLYTDEYAAVTEERRVGTLPLETPTPLPTSTPKRTPVPDTEDMP